MVLGGGGLFLMSEVPLYLLPSGVSILALFLGLAMNFPHPPRSTLQPWKMILARNPNVLVSSKIRITRSES